MHAPVSDELEQLEHPQDAAELEHPQQQLTAHLRHEETSPADASINPAKLKR